MSPEKYIALPSSSKDLKNKHLIQYVFRVLPGILFLTSATAKLAGIDAFELYLFSFGWFSLGTAYLLARLVIAAEYTLGILLIANFYPRLALWGSVAMLAAFSLFLAGLLVAGKNDNCHCFGEWVDLDPLRSLAKNAGMLVLLSLGAGIRPFNIRFKPLWLALAIVIPLATVLIVSPPDNWRYDSYGRSEPINEPAFREALAEGILPASIEEGDHIVCFYSLKCKFCKMSARKLMTLLERGDIEAMPIVAVFGRGDDPDPTPFFVETGLEASETLFIEPSDFLRITKGAFPVILVMHGPEITTSYNYRNLH